MEDYVNGLNNILIALSNCIQDMMSYQNVLDTYKFKTDPDNGLLMWQVSRSLTWMGASLCAVCGIEYCEYLFTSMLSASCRCSRLLQK